MAKNNFLCKYILSNLSISESKTEEIAFEEKAVKRFIFVEDLESMYLTGEVEIHDVGGIIEALELTGNEKFKIELEIYDGEEKQSQKNITFDIFNISSVPSSNPNINLYKFILAEEGLTKLSDKRYSKSYKDENISSILEDVLKNQLDIKKYNIEETSNKMDFIIPYWSPVFTLRYLLRLAKGTKGPGFLFFTNLEGDGEEPKKNIISLESLLAKKASQKEEDIYYIKKYDISPHYRNLIIDYKNVAFASKRDQRKGFYGKTYIGIDFNKKKEILMSSNSLDDFIKKATFLGDTLNIEKDKNESFSEVTFRGYPSQDLLDAESLYWFRMGTETTNIKEVLCPGYQGRWVGQIIHVDEASDITTKVTDKHIQLTGNWLIKKIVHVIKSDVDYSQRITLIKNAFNQLTNTTDFKSITKKNL